MIKREVYLKKIRPLFNKPVIKAITGIRRCGKSTLMQQIITEFQESGIAEERIIFINKELFEFDFIKGYADLHNFVTSNTPNNSSHTYLLIDEIQEIDQWERAVNSLLATKKYDIYITGSNARLMSSELATLLSGRYIEFRMFTFTFPEFVLLSEESNNHQHQGQFDRFLKYGGFPGIHVFEWDETAVRQYINSLYNTILLKDIVVRYKIRDVEMLSKIIEFVIDNCGNITTAKNISNFVKSQFRNVSVDTVQNYIRYTLNAFLLEQARRYDLKGKRLLETHEKYFLGDIGFRLATIGYTPDALSGQLENAVLLYLLANDYQVNIGKINNTEVDFVATKNQDKLYIQVCATLADSKVIDREYGSLEKITDHFPKLVLSLDKGFETSRKGIRWKNIKDFFYGPI
ncbi:MAG: hypothetical protein B6D64_14415 [Bacteroidetes bacterium 4484_276]|nr:MAG: hypothetical protein B6D64_14415 [Bacteroidetes bacterium 4484_276]